MPSVDQEAWLSQFVSAFNDGDFAAFDRLLLPSFFGYVPQPGEPTAPEAFRDVGQALRAACPDCHLTLEPVTEAGDELRGLRYGPQYSRVTLEGAFTGNLWGRPGSGGRHSLSGTAVARFEGERLALRWEEMDLVGTLRGMGLMPQPENAHRKPPYPVTIPEIILRLLFNGLRLQEKPCSHLGRIRVTEPATQVCEQCVASGDEWPALRMCLECGFVGCCDLSVNKHMKKHCEATGHAIFRSIQPGEAWIWCYPDSAFLSSRHLPRHMTA
jgi:predicted ester cyclase